MNIRPNHDPTKTRAPQDAESARLGRYLLQIEATEVRPHFQLRDVVFVADRKVDVDDLYQDQAPN